MISFNNNWDDILKDEIDCLKAKTWFIKEDNFPFETGTEKTNITFGNKYFYKVNIEIPDCGISTIYNIETDNVINSNSNFKKYI